jgi:hypothetical protein
MLLMKTVTIHFTGGEPCQLRLPDEAAAAVLGRLSDPSEGTTTITDRNGTAWTINRARITWAQAA